MTAREFAATVTVLMQDQTAYGRISMRSLMMIEGVLEVVLGEVRVEIHRRQRPKLRIVKK